MPEAILDELKRIIGDRTENRDAFFRRIYRHYPERSPEYRIVLRAYNIGKDGFRDQVRKDGQTRSFEHARGAALILMDYLGIFTAWMIAALLLHDVVEDLNQYTLDRLYEEFREFGDDAIRMIEMLERMTKPSKKDGYSEEEAEDIYHEWFKSAPRVFFIFKLCDRIYNLLTIESLDADKQREMVEETKIHYLPYAREHGILYRETLEAVGEIEKRLAA
ncbi:MAG TPA: HD domain-containing protein [Candidatus Fimivivens sp.]|nr:HD domain-containing protein [Candidatus Fimivivens sp.]